MSIGGLSDPAMEEALHDVPLYREFAGLGDGVSRLPDETTILRFRHLLEAHDLAADMLRVVNDILQAKGLLLRTGTAVDATLIAAPSSTKNAEGERDPEMRCRATLRHTIVHVPCARETSRGCATAFVRRITRLGDTSRKIKCRSAWAVTIYRHLSERGARFRVDHRLRLRAPIIVHVTNS